MLIYRYIIGIMIMQGDYTESDLFKIIGVIGLII